MPATALDTAERVMRSLAQDPVRHLIGGECVDSERRFDIIDPATGRQCAVCPDASRDQLEQAVLAARKVQPRWAATPIEERRGALRALAGVLRDHVDELGALITLEQGKPLPAARGEVSRAADMLETLVTISLDDEVLRHDARGRVVMHHRPLGVIGAIAPWNVPIGLAVPKIVHAVYTGNAVVLKPSPYTPLATLRLGQLARHVFPAGVLNVLAGGNELGQWISEHAGIDGMSVTGSVLTGKRVMASAANNLKRLTLELGGNDPAIVMPDADIERIAPALFAASFINSGQVCMAIKRLYVHESLVDRAAELMAGLAKAAKVGSGFDKGIQFGPLQNKTQHESVKKVLENTKSQPGARILSGGSAIDRDGYFIEPTVVTGLHEGSMLVDEETFGPVLPILSYASESEVASRANASSLGLGASIWTSDPEGAAGLASRIESGTVWINRHVGGDPEVPFAGLKESGLGCQYGRAGMLGYMQSSAIYFPAVEATQRGD